MKTIALLAGARPNYMKIYPLWREITERHADRFKPVIIHTGQHYDPLMNDIFFSDLGMPKPDHFLGIGSGTHGAQTGKAMVALEELFMKQRPDILVVVGDVNSTVAGALVAVKMGIPVAHVEAGLRSGDRSMPEEINRLVTDAISDLLLTPSEDANMNLLREGIAPENIHLVGNIMIDSLIQLLPKAQESEILKQLSLPEKGYVAVTLHRPSNVDDPDTLFRILRELETVAKHFPVVFPIHPRTRKILDAHPNQWTNTKLIFIDPLGYTDFLRLESAAALVITDSGGIQEETSYLGIPCLTLRQNTERPVTLSQGTNRLVNPTSESLAELSLDAIRNPRAPKQIPMWDGQTAGRIMEILEKLP